jgi:hypothetical protein
MTTTPKDGGPAFPRPGYTDATGDWPVFLRHEEGMTLRDYIAGQALPQAVEDYDRKTRGVMDTKNNVLPWATKETGTREEIIARQAYRYADAMLKARETDND